MKIGLSQFETSLVSGMVGVSLRVDLTMPIKKRQLETQLRTQSNTQSKTHTTKQTESPRPRAEKRKKGVGALIESQETRVL